MASPEERMARFLARPPRSKKTRAYLESLQSAPPRPKPTFVMIHEPKHYGCFTEPMQPPKKSEDQYKAAMKRVRRILKRYPLTPAPPMPPLTIPVREEVESKRAGIKGRIIRRGGTDPDLAIIAKLQAQRCILCGERFDLSLPRVGLGIVNEMIATIEHVIPRARGGRQRGNKLVTHRRCNALKADAMPNGCELIWLAAVNARLGLAA